MEDRSDDDSVRPAHGSVMDHEELLVDGDIISDDEEVSMEELPFFSIGNIKQNILQNANARNDEKVNVVVAE